MTTPQRPNVEDYQLLNIDAALQGVIDDLAQDFGTMFSRETVARLVRESYDLLAATSRIQHHIPIFAGRFARERLTAIAQTSGQIHTGLPEVLFVCNHNAGRSQMAAALLERHAQGKVHVRSAGSIPAADIEADVLQVMHEIGIDLTVEFPKPLTDEIVRAADVVVTMGCGDACPVYPGKRYVDWPLDDPANQTIEQLRELRDEIDSRTRQLAADLLTPA